MDVEALSPGVAAVLDRLDAVIEDLAGLEVDPGSAGEARALVRRMERAQRCLDAVAARVAERVHSSKVFAEDGHRSVSGWLTSTARVSSAEARRRARRARTIRDLPEVAAAYAAGEMSSCALDRIGRVLANPRVRAKLVALDEQLAVIAARLTYLELDRKLTVWERMADEDGPDPFDRQHRGRNARVFRDGDGGMHLDATFDSVAAVRHQATFAAFLQDEVDADWAEARARLGDAATWSGLTRTDAQRRADAVTRIFDVANAARADLPGCAPAQGVIVMDHATAEHVAQQLDPLLPDPPPRPTPALTWDPDPAGVHGRCSDLDGHPVDPRLGLVECLVGGLRRAVFDDRGVCIDLGRTTRCFRDHAQLAARLSAKRCEIDGCDTVVTRTQTDHRIGWAEGGRTDQDNALCLCGPHNRLKERGYQLIRDADGTWHLRRRDADPPRDGDPSHGHDPPQAA
ncbi:MAG: DUF222 domain-containing protein [Acidimicrobiales bacterium]|nr:DUF222 domain-containing protein [Acidimicrobiales bacterium]